MHILCTDAKLPGPAVFPTLLRSAEQKVVVDCVMVFVYECVRVCLFQYLYAKNEVVLYMYGNVMAMWWRPRCTRNWIEQKRVCEAQHQTSSAKQQHALAVFIYLCTEMNRFRPGVLFWFVKCVTNYIRIRYTQLGAGAFSMNNWDILKRYWHCEGNYDRWATVVCIVERSSSIQLELYDISRVTFKRRPMPVLAADNRRSFVCTIPFRKSCTRYDKHDISSGVLGQIAHTENEPTNKRMSTHEKWTQVENRHAALCRQLAKRAEIAFLRAYPSGYPHARFHEKRSRTCTLRKKRIRWAAGRPATIRHDAIHQQQNVTGMSKQNTDKNWWYQIATIFSVRTLTF